jgi:membrane protein implicated in regulation of membrane protease activity
MAETTRVQHEGFDRAQGRSNSGAFHRVWQRISLIVTRTVFWSYERGSWQYDLICVAILALIFLAPRSWFRDRPTLQLTDLRHNQGTVDLGLDKDGRRYMVDARLVESMGSMKLEDAISTILRRRLRVNPKVKSIDPIEDRNRVVLGYTVVVAP